MTARVLAVVGPTASGKSAVAMQVARRRGDVEIVAVDAFTVYRGLDIGTAKPSPAERAEVPHHVVDVLDPTEELDVATFQRLARDAVADVRGRGRTPLLVGGSGLYWRAVVDDMVFPPTDPDVRTRIEQRYADDPAAAHAAVAAVDPVAAGRIEPGNLRRSVRALEVLELTGRPFSAFGDTPHASVVGELSVAYLEPGRDEHREAVWRRAAAMVDRGLVDELAEVRRRWGRLSSTAAQGIGYAEAGEVLDGRLPLDELAERIASRTWAYARRQRSWFRRDPRCDAEAPASVVRRLAG